MIKISIRDIIADLPPSILKKRIKEIDRINKIKENEQWKTFGTPLELWNWILANVHIGDKCDIVFENNFGKIIDLKFYGISIVEIEIYRNNGTVYRYKIDKGTLEGIRFRIDSAGELFINGRNRN